MMCPRSVESRQLEKKQIDCGRRMEGGRRYDPLIRLFFPFSAVGRRKMDRLNYDFFHTWMRKGRERDVEFE